MKNKNSQLVLLPLTVKGCFIYENKNIYEVNIIYKYRKVKYRN